MARVEAAPQSVVASGLEASFAAATADNVSFTNSVDQRTLFWVKNGDGSDHDVTFHTSETRDGNAVADLTVTITAGKERLMGPFPAGVYNQSDGTVYADFSATTSMTYAVINIPAR